MRNSYHTIIIGGGCLGVACAISLQRKLGHQKNKVAILEKKVLGAGLSSRHSAIVRSANASKMSARLARLATEHWKNLRSVWGVTIPFEQPGAIWIADTQSKQTLEHWLALERSMQQEQIQFGMISAQDAAKLSHNSIKISPDEMYFHEPAVLQLDAPEILHAMQTAIKKAHVDVIEHCQVYDFECDAQQNISAIHSSQGRFSADHIINASGGWSAELFASIGLQIPVALEPVYAANFLVSASEIPMTMPIIADYVNDAYFRRWRGSVLHMHQPRRRKGPEIARSFSRASMNPEGANVIYDALSFDVNHQQLDAYLGKVQNRFPGIGKPVYAGGYQSFFDITPDLKFILGADNVIYNLYHCLGAGQSLKYAPIFGELMAELIVDERIITKDADIGEFSIARFAEQPLSDFWQPKQSDSLIL